MNILSVDSSTRYLSVAVSRDSSVIYEAMSRAGTGHMVNIMGMLDRTLGKSKIELKDIDVFGVNSGPGDFTGTRIGVSVIKMLAFLEEKPAYGINSLDAVAVGMVLKNINLIAGSPARGVSIIVMPCLDVRRKEVYFSFYSSVPAAEAGGGGNYIAKIGSGKDIFFIKKESRNFLVGYDKLKGFLDGLVESRTLRVPGSSAIYRNPEVVIGGNCYKAYRETLSNIIKHGKVYILDKKTAYPRAGYVNACAYYNALKKAGPGNITPVYVREFIPFGGADKDKHNSNSQQ
jgi:tRNA threonylcarbamoyl adenosine modification protein YeaZ